jgi:hypothetical protein
MGTSTLALAALLLVQSGQAQVDLMPINQRNFQIPIHIDMNRRRDMKVLILYASDDQGRTWKEVATASPDQEAFKFFAPADGVYWFNLCVEDQQGRREPPDIYKSPPRQKILVDTLKPLIRLTSVGRQGEDVVVAWEIQEDHPDLATLKLEYRPQDSSAWTAAPLSQATFGQARFRVGYPGAVMVRMQVKDQAGNESIAEGEASAVANGIPAVAAGGGPALGGSTPTPAVPVSFPGASAAAPAPSVPAPAPAPAPTMPAPTFQPAVQSNYGLASGSKADPVADQFVPRFGGINDPKVMVATTERTERPAPAPTQTGPRGSLPPLQVVNTPQLNIDYVVEKVGPSGLGRVELWLTQDDGRTWRLFAEDTDLKPPITVELPGPGVYGFTLLVKSRAGLGARPPQTGEPPQMRVELDTEPPVAQLYAPETDPRQRGALMLSWNATDRNLAASPITLQWAERAEASWQTIAADLPNTGRHSWQLPPNLPYKVYLRLIVRDTAGNTSIAETSEPVLVDLSEPEARIKGLVMTPIRP